MRILAVNGGACGSSWEVCKSVLLYAKTLGHQVYAATPDRNPNIDGINYYQIGSKTTRLVNRILTRYDGSDGFRNKVDTKKLINFIKKIHPDVVHLHTLHGYFINIKLLIDYLKTTQTKLVITCHDCWWFTGRCSHFFANGCEKWMDKCEDCKFKGVYPKTLFKDNANKYLLEKKKIFKDYENLVVVCVSEWLRNLCKQSQVFKGKQVFTVHNGVDQIYFNNIKHNIETNPKQFISIASQWTIDKGVEIITGLCNLFPDYSFLLIGKLDCKNKPTNLKNIEYITSKQELANLCKESFALLNASKQETFSLVNIEAQLCGLPVVCYSETGMKETIAPDSIRVEKYTLESFANAIKILIKTDVDCESILRFASRFSKEKMNKQYLSIYLNGEKNHE